MSLPSISFLLHSTNPPPTPLYKLHYLNIHDPNVFLWFLLITSYILDPMHHVQTLHGAAEDGVFAVEPGGFLSRYKEL